MILERSVVYANVKKWIESRIWSSWHLNCIRIGSFSLVLLTCVVDHRDPSEIVRPRISITACIEAFATPEVVDDFYSTALQAKSVAQKWVTDITSKHVSLFPCQILSVWERRPIFEARGSRKPWKVHEKLQHRCKHCKVGQFWKFPKRQVPSGCLPAVLESFLESIKIVVFIVDFFMHVVDQQDSPRFQIIWWCKWKNSLLVMTGFLRSSVWLFFL